MNVDKLTLKQKYDLYIKKFEELCQISQACGFGDPSSYARSKEIYMAGKLGHTIADNYSGADAFDKKGNPLEYKSTISKEITASYTGVSLQSSWAEQERYLREDKIGKYKEHYIARFNNGLIEEVYKLTGQQVLDELLPKFKKQWRSRQKSMPKDPRLGATINRDFIVNNGVKVI